MTLGQVKSSPNFCLFGPQRAEKRNIWRQKNTNLNLTAGLCSLHMRADVARISNVLLNTGWYFLPAVFLSQCLYSIVSFAISAARKQLQKRDGECGVRPFLGEPWGGAVFSAPLSNDSSKMCHGMTSFTLSTYLPVASKSVLKIIVHLFRRMTPFQCSVLYCMLAPPFSRT